MARERRLSRSGPEALARAAARLRRRAGPLYPAAAGLPALFFVTDPQRIADPVAVADRLPRGAGVIFRGFGRPGAGETAARLAATARRRGLLLLVGADPELAAAVGAAGVHLPERLAALAPRLRPRHPRWIVTGAAHSARALARSRAMGLDAALLSPAFASASASAQGVRPLGPARFARLVAGAGLPVYALGGVTAANADRLEGAWGVAAVDSLTPEA